MSSKRPPDRAANGSLPAKRMKFDGRHPTMLAGEETYDPLQEDIGTGHSRKKQVKLDGYESDSDYEGHGVDRAANLDNETGPVDDDDDMFGEPPSALGDRNTRDAEADKKKGTKFWSLNDIEGQDFSTRQEFMDIVDEDDDDNDGHGEDVQDDDDSIDEEVGALGRKKNAPKLDSFNMRAELEEGQFDSEGNYIRTARDEKDNQDDWLRDVSRRDITKAQEAVERRAQEEAARAQREGAEESVAELLAELVTFLERGETLLEALARIGGGAAAAGGGGGSTGHNSGKSAVRRRQKQKKGSSGKAIESAEVKAVERMTELANKLMAKSQIDVYDTEREGLTRAYKRETGIDLPVTNGTSHRDNDHVMHDDDRADAWEFIWPGAEDAIHGPYDRETMKSWLSDGLLTSDASVAQVRRVGEIVFVEASAQLFENLT